jgi:putative SOS response-associated peptidase YedK
MCGRYYRRSDKQRIAEVFKLGRLPEGFELPPDWNIAPSTNQPIIRSDPETGEREMVLMRWGLIPAKIADPDSFKIFTTTNARAEGILDKPIWKGPFSHSRCLIPLDGFYEWVRPESRPDDCPEWSHDRTCRPIGSTLGGQAGW